MGGTEVKITGEGLGRSVKFGDTTVLGRFDSRYPGALMLVFTPEHTAGIVSVAVTSLSGQTVATSQTFTYAAPKPLTSTAAGPVSATTARTLRFDSPSGTCPAYCSATAPTLTSRAQT